MRIIARSTIRAFAEAHPRARAPLEAWCAEVEAAVWTSPNDIKAQYRSASVIGGDRVVFNIAGNKFRLVVAVEFEHRIVFIKFIGTHAEYDRVDAQTIGFRRRREN
jgi:mRNA interferase HigB